MGYVLKQYKGGNDWEPTKDIVNDHKSFKKEAGLEEEPDESFDKLKNELSKFRNDKYNIGTEKNGINRTAFKRLQDGFKNLMEESFAQEKAMLASMGWKEDDGITYNENDVFGLSGGDIKPISSKLSKKLRDFFLGGTEGTEGGKPPSANLKKLLSIMTSSRMQAAFSGKTSLSEVNVKHIATESKIPVELKLISRDRVFNMEVHIKQDWMKNNVKGIGDNTKVQEVFYAFFKQYPNFVKDLLKELLEGNSSRSIEPLFQSAIFDVFSDEINSKIEGFDNTIFAELMSATLYRYMAPPAEGSGQKLHFTLTNTDEYKKIIDENVLAEQIKEWTLRALGLQRAEKGQNKDISVNRRGNTIEVEYTLPYAKPLGGRATTYSKKNDDYIMLFSWSSFFGSKIKPTTLAAYLNSTVVQNGTTEKIEAAQNSNIQDTGMGDAEKQFNLILAKAIAMSNNNTDILEDENKLLDQSLMQYWTSGNEFSEPLSVLFFREIRNSQGSVASYVVNGRNSPVYGTGYAQEALATILVNEGIKTRLGKNLNTNALLRTQGKELSNGKQVNADNASHYGGIQQKSLNEKTLDGTINLYVGKEPVNFLNIKSTEKFFGDSAENFAYLVSNATFMNKVYNTQFQVKDLNEMLAFYLPAFFRYMDANVKVDIKSQDLSNKVLFYSISYLIIPMSRIFATYYYELQKFNEETKGDFISTLFESGMSNKVKISDNSEKLKRQFVTEGNPFPNPPTVDKVEDLNDLVGNLSDVDMKSSLRFSYKFKGFKIKLSDIFSDVKSLVLQ